MEHAAGAVLMRDFILITSTQSALQYVGLHSRFIQGAMMVSHGYRHDVNIYLVFMDKFRYMLIRGNAVRGILPDESSIAYLMKEFLSGEARKGIVIGAAELRNILRRTAQPTLIIPMARECNSHVRLGRDFTLIVNYYSPDLDSFLCGKGFGLSRISLDQVSIIVNYVADNGLEIH